MSKDPSDQIIDDREAGKSSGVGDNPFLFLKENARRI